MIFGKYSFYCRLENDALLPPFKGSTFRGVFGRALKRVVCPLRNKTCDSCLLREKCLYSLVFETLSDNIQIQGARASSPPHPFVIEPPLTEAETLKEGEKFDFNLLLFGEVNRSLSYFIYAFEQMGKIGLGKRVNGHRGHFLLERVNSYKGNILYSSGDKTLRDLDSYQDLNLREPGKKHEGHFQVKISLVTPLRLKYKNRLNAELPFHVLVRAMLRRVSSLFNYYGQGEPALDYRRLVKDAEKVSIKESNIRWFDWRRYSRRQERSMLMGGMLGSAIYEGDLTEYLPLIEFSTRAHIGKQTAFGLGKIEAEVLE